MKILLIFISLIVHFVCSQDDGPEILSVSVDGLLMENAKITSSATCGTDGPERYCRLVDEIADQGFTNQDNRVFCDICDNRNETKRHPIEFAKSNDDNLWWQSPSMAQGLKYQNVNVTIDLKQVYQIVYILLKMGDSPRPGNWILERSLDGEIYMPWIFFAETPYSCYNLFQRRYPDLQLTTSDKPNSLGDDEMFCTTHYSQPKSLNSGEIIISLINGRKSLINEEYLTVKSVPQKLINFLSARYIRFRFLKHLTLAADLMTHKGYLESSIFNRYYYSLRNIEIGGKCICNNHADKCDKVVNNGITVARCNCKHNTCGNNCEYCCPLFNQKPWKPVKVCEECNCNRKSNKCAYNQTVATLQLSINKMGRMEGGGVCIDCQENTEGINCEKCKRGFFRPWNVLATESYPCKICKCNGIGTVGNCVSNGEEIGDQKPGDCICKKGYEGINCDSCSIGYERYPNGECLPCPCSIDGSVVTSLYRCKRPCNCKINVNSDDDCKTCKNGYFNLNPKNDEGCEPCYCFGITNQCSSLSARNLQINELKDWKLSTINGDKTAIPKLTPLQYLTSENSYLEGIFDNPTVYYWTAPQPFLGNWITSYGTIFRYVVQIELLSSNGGSQIDSPDVIIKCGDFRLFYSVSSEDRRLQRKVLIDIKPSYWKIGQLNPEKETNKEEFISCLINVEALLIKAKYYSNQKSIGLLNVTLSRGEFQTALNEMPHIEKCICPPNYSGLSCESCAIGYRRVNKVLYQGQCKACECYNHSNTCDSLTGQCQNCLHNTAGSHCDECSPGYYGNAKLKQSNSCKKCACPLIDYQMTGQCSSYSSENYICHDCYNNTSGVHCDRCAEGYYGNPNKKIPCKKCRCNDNQEGCNSITGECRCSFNTMGSECHLCKHGFYGNALNKTCRKCNCNTFGSKSQVCDKQTGQCACQTNFVNRKCDTCAPGLYLKGKKCEVCECSILGRIASEKFCNSTTGKCFCLSGINGEQCEKCLPGYYNYPNCKKCQCSSHALSPICDIKDGSCLCGSNVLNHLCDKCQNFHYWKNQTDCAPCNCGKGSLNNLCDMDSGRCNCAENVIRRDCNICKPGYFGLSSNGCKKCPLCFNGKVCNDEGNCVCPPNTIGNLCEKCAVDSWDFNETFGCQKCDCDLNGSISEICDKKSGVCICKSRFKGVKCNECNDGYYGFPNCVPCSCSKNGTLPRKLTQCDKITGQCQCKPNVMGNKCDLCKKGTFPSVGTYEGGCFSCFCFGISDKCEPLLNHRIVENSNYNFHIFDEKNSFEIGKDHSVIEIVPNSPKKFGWPFSMFRPVYMDVVKLFESHDLSLFYRSTILNISIDCLDNNCGRENSVQTEVVMESYNGLFGLRYLINHSLLNNNQIDIEFNEYSKHGKWVISKYKNDLLNKFIIMDDTNAININLTRDIFMMALLNVTSFKVKLYTESVNPLIVKLNIQTYKAVNTMENIGKPISSVERCNCNSITMGNHCQKSIKGYFKEYYNLPDSPNGLDLRTGNRIKVNYKKCSCNGFSNICDGTSGYCLNCTENRTGNKCQLCIEGFYMDPNSNICKPCQCPNESYNFASSCTKITSSIYKCLCKIGYTGNFCEKCENGFYGNPIYGIPCKSCNCNPEGSENSNCNEKGKCKCAPGVLGMKCDQCAADYVVENKKCKSCYTGCTKELFIRVNKLNNTIANFKWKTLPSTVDLRLKQINISIQTISDRIDSVLNFVNTKEEIKNLFNQFENTKSNTKTKYQEIEQLKNRFKKVEKDIKSIIADIKETITENNQLKSTDDLIRNSTEILGNIERFLNAIPNIASVDSFSKNVLKYVSDLNNKNKQIQSLYQTDLLNQLKILKDKIIIANEINKDNKEYLKDLNNTKIQRDSNEIGLNSKIEELQKHLNKIIQDKKNLESNIQSLGNFAENFQNKSDEIFKIVMEIEMLLNTTNNKFISKNLIIPDTIKKHVEAKINKSSRLISNLSKDFNFLHNAEQAKKAYSNISRDILAVDKVINKTQQQLDESKFNININLTKNLLFQSNNNKSDLEKKKQRIEIEHENLKNQYKILAINQESLNETNKRLLLEIPKESYNISFYQKEISAIQSKQNDIENNLFEPIKKSIMNFKIPKIESGFNTTLIENLITNVDNRYREMVNDSVSVRRKIKQLRENIKLLRDRLRKAKILAALTHGAAARSSEPIRHVERCVRHYITYYLPSSNAFSLEFFMKPQFPGEQSLVLFGYDDSGSVPHSFAFTIEKNSQFRFWYNYGQATESIEVIKVISPSNYVGVLITWKLGKWNMIIKSINNGQMEFSTTVRKISNSIHVGPKTNVFIGGYPSSKLLGSLKLEGNLVSMLKENYERNFYKGCLFGVKLMNSEFGLQDIDAVEEDCKKMISIKDLLKETFNCKFNLNSSIIFSDSNLESLSKSKRSVIRKKREVENKFNLHFSGNGYGMINTSKTIGCKSKLNKVLSIEAKTLSIVNPEIFQLITVFANHKLDIGFVLGLKNSKYHFGYWKGNMEFPIRVLQNASEKFNWYVFRNNFGIITDKIFGINEICDPNSFFYLADIPNNELNLIARLNRLKVSNFGFVGRMKFTVNKKNEFQVLATRFINILFLFNDRIREKKFHSLFISSETKKAIEINKNLSNDLLQSGFSFTVNFLGQPLTKTVTLFSVELTQGSITVELSPDLVFSVVVNNVEIKKELQKFNMDNLDWETHYIVVFLEISSEYLTVSISVDNEESKSQEITGNFGEISRVLIGSNSTQQQAYYFYNLFLGEKLIDFKELDYLPPGVYLKLRSTNLQPTDVQYPKMDFDKTSPRVSNKHGENPQFDAVALPYINSHPLYTSSKLYFPLRKRKVTNYTLYTSKSKDYPANSVWFEGNSNTISKLTNDILQNYRKPKNNEISFKIRSPSRRPEMLISLSFSNKILNIVTFNGHLILYEPTSRRTANFPVTIIDEEWHTVRITSSASNPERGIRIYQDKHSFNSSSSLLTFTYPSSIEIGGFSEAIRNLFYKNESHQLYHFTGCLDDFRINDQLVSMKKTDNSNSLKSCPRVLQFLHSGGEIQNSFSGISDKFIKLVFESHSIEKTDSHIINFKFKYTGFESGNLLIIEGDRKYCSVGLFDKQIKLGYLNSVNKEKSIQAIKINTEKWYKIEFILYHDGDYSECKIIVDDDKQISLPLLDNQIFPKRFNTFDAYFGNHPSLSLSDKLLLWENSRNFIGCISDVECSTNTDLVSCSFDRSEHFIGGRCSLDKDTYLLRKY